MQFDSSDKVQGIRVSNSTDDESYDVFFKGKVVGLFGGVGNALDSSPDPLAVVSDDAPVSPRKGDIYFNTTDNHFYGWNGTEWRQLDN